MNRLVKQTYFLLVHRWGRYLLIQVPLLDRLLGNPLTALDHFVLRRLSRHTALNPLACHGLKISLRPEDWVLSLGDWEPETTRIVQELLGPGMTFVDLGAHLGYYTLLASRAVGPGGRVYAFEPVPSTRALLTHNINQNGYNRVVTIVPKAISDKPGRVQIFLDEKDSAAATMWATGFSASASIEVESISLDQFFREEGWPEVQLVKMDIEGAEKAAIEGMRELAHRNPGLKLILEFSLDNLSRAGVRPEELFESLRACGFSRFRALFRRGQLLAIPRDIPRLVDLAKHKFGVNLLCEKEATGGL